MLEKINSCASSILSDYIVSEFGVVKYIKKLKPGTAPGLDQIRPEHLKHGVQSLLSKVLSTLFTLCIKFGVIPRSFSEGLLIPILKKPNIDPSNPSNYRPITVSVTLSKILEYHIMDSCASHKFSGHQFGFIPTRGTNMATALAHDICLFQSFRIVNI